MFFQTTGDETAANQFIKIKEGSNEIEKVRPRTFVFKRTPFKHHHRAAQINSLKYDM